MLVCILVVNESQNVRFVSSQRGSLQYFNMDGNISHGNLKTFMYA